MKQVSLLACLLIATLTSCRWIGEERISGNGKIVTEPYDITGFSKVKVMGAMKLHVTQGDAYAVKIETDENLMEFIIVQREGDVLVVRPERGITLRASDDVHVYVTAPKFEAFRASGASEVIGETALSGHNIFIDLSGASTARLDLKYDDVDVEVSGAGQADLRGEVRSLDVEASGASHVNAGDLKATEADLDLSGASFARVHVTGRLDADASGASEIFYSGGATVQSRASGASTIREN